jgi:hypothetical protein
MAIADRSRGSVRNALSFPRRCCACSVIEPHGGRPSLRVCCGAAMTWTLIENRRTGPCTEQTRVPRNAVHHDGRSRVHQRRHPA